MPAVDAAARFVRSAGHTAARLVGLDYDATDSTNRRRSPRTTLHSSDRHLDPARRRKLVATARDASRNFEVAAWGVRKHLDYVATFSRQVRTPVEGFNRELERWLTEADEADRFDAAGRHDRHSYLRQAEARRVEDGDCFSHLNRDGRVDLVESDRIRTPAGIEGQRYTHGVRTDRRGRALAYALHDRTRWSAFEYRRDLSARWMIPLAYYQRYDQVRGISPLAPALNRLRDCYEGFDYAHAKAKINQLFGLALFRDDDESLGDLTTAEDDDGNEDKSAASIDFGQGPFQLDLGAQDKAEILESKIPATEFSEYSRLMILIALKALDIPFSFFDESFTNYSGSRGALLLYEQSADQKRNQVAALLRRLDTWRLRLAILDGRLSLPRGVDLAAIRRALEYIPAGLPWLDPLKEVSADVKAIQNGLTSRTRVLKRRNSDFDEVARELARERDILADIMPAAQNPKST